MKTKPETHYPKNLNIPDLIEMSLAATIAVCLIARILQLA